MARQEVSELRAEHLLSTGHGVHGFPGGERRAYCVRNDRELQVTNGTLGTVVSIGAEQLAEQSETGISAADYP